MNLGIFREKEHKSLVYGKSIFFDTNCYRELARQIKREGTYRVNQWIKSLQKQEKKAKITSKLSYLVVTELFTHLGVPITSNSYEECKLAIQIAIAHINKNTKRILSDYDNQIIQCIHGEIPKLRESTEKSLLDLVIHLADNQFNDRHIKSKERAFKAAKEYLESVKTNWRETSLENFINKYQDSTGNNSSQIFANDIERRNKKLKQLEDGEQSGRIFDFFAAGVFMYYNDSLMPSNPILVSIDVLNRIKKRFLPSFKLQLRILKLICQSGYNLNKNEKQLAHLILEPIVQIHFVAPLILLSMDTVFPILTWPHLYYFFY